MKAVRNQSCAREKCCVGRKLMHRPSQMNRDPIVWIFRQLRRSQENHEGLKRFGRDKEKWNSRQRLQHSGGAFYPGTYQK